MKQQRISKKQARALQKRMEELASSVLLVPPHPEPGRVEFVRPVQSGHSEAFGDANHKNFALPNEDSLKLEGQSEVGSFKASDAGMPNGIAVVVGNDENSSTEKASTEQGDPGSNLKAPIKMQILLNEADPVSLTWDFNLELLPAEQSLVSLDSVSKRFGEKVAITELSFEVPAGGFYAIVGPNGAGKTTTLSLLSGLLKPDAGSITVFGAEHGNEIELLRENVGVLPDRMYTFDRLTGRQLLHYNGVLRGMSPAKIPDRISELAKAFQIDADLARSVSDYSLGMTKKILLACALIHSPLLLILDEPFEGLDPKSAATILAILQDYTRAGGTVIFSSHGMDLVEQVCDHIAVIAHGRLVSSGALAEIRGDGTLTERFFKLTDSSGDGEMLSWLQNFSD